MASNKLSGLLQSTPIAIPEADDTWPIPTQFLGVEIEVEGHRNSQATALTRADGGFWTVKQDGSLRNGVEFVFSQPLMGKQLSTAISQFFSIVKDYSTSPRTSIHVHMNMRQDYDTMESLRNLVILYFMYEHAFFSLADENRKWCTYCSPFEDNMPTFLTSIFRGDTPKQVVDHIRRANNHDRYYGLNIAALARYGTVEFRHFPCVKEQDRLMNWLLLLMELKLAATRMAEEGVSPYDMFSKTQDIALLDGYMPRFGPVLRNIVSDDEALRRLSITAMYRAGDIPQRYDAVDATKNKMFGKFVSKKMGDKPVAAPPRTEQVIRNERQAAYGRWTAATEAHGVGSAQERRERDAYLNLDRELAAFVRRRLQGNDGPQPATNWADVAPDLNVFQAARRAARPR